MLIELIANQNLCVFEADIKICTLSHYVISAIIYSLQAYSVLLDVCVVDSKQLVIFFFLLSYWHEYAPV
jgi:hypothetical protein